MPFMDILLVANYKDFPKGDARRYFVVLLAAARLKDRATTHHIAAEIGCTRAEAQRALEAAAAQFKIEYERIGTAYRITSWGALKRSAVQAAISSSSTAANRSY